MYSERDPNFRKIQTCFLTLILYKIYSKTLVDRFKSIMCFRTYDGPNVGGSIDYACYVGLIGVCKLCQRLICGEL